jgi:tetratricopeptide (TPR) repeat protein
MATGSQNQYLEILKRQGIVVNDMEGYIIEMRMEVKDLKVRETQVWFARGTGAYIISLSCVEQEYDNYQSIFEKVMKSFTFLPYEVELDALFSEAVEQYKEQSFPQALEKFKKARKGYQQLKEESRLPACDDYIEKCEKGSLADSLNIEAGTLFMQNKYDEAKSKFEKA